ncbi:MAG: glycosyltransferase family 2 protein [Bacteroidota bacterium]
MPGSQPDVAVVIPLYNNAPWVEETLASVRAQALAPAEVVVVDDGSTDGGPDRVDALPGVRLVESPGNGASAARRHGQNLTTAPLIVFLDADDLWDPEHLRLLAAALDTDPDAGAAVGRTQSFLDGDVRQRRRPPRLATTSVDPWDQFPSTFTSTPSSVLIRRRVLESTGGWVQGIIGCADFYTWLRLSERGPLVQNHATTVWRRKHHTSHSARLRSSPDHVLRYIQSKVTAAQSALDSRVRARPDKADESRRLSVAVDTMPAIASGGLASDRDRVSAAAAALEDVLEGFPESRVRAFLRNLTYYLKGLKDAHQSRVFAFLARAWPEDAPRTREALRRFAPAISTPSSGSRA